MLKKNIMRRIVLPEGVITLATHEKISLVVVILYFFNIFILGTGSDMARE